MTEWLAFLALGAVAVAGALGMLLTMSMYRAAIFLMASFVALAGVFVLLGADLLAAIQVMMNVGGMLVMLLFMVPLMMDPGGEMMWEMKRKMGLPGFAALSMAMPRQPPPPEHETPHAGGPPLGAPTPTDWTCPMHPEVSAPGPGKCPKCGMDLVRRAELDGGAPGPEDGMSRAPATQYTCPMHPEVASDKPGACPKCGMDLVPVQQPERSEQPGTGAYTCPMHPDVRSDRPGTCPKCGMALTPASGASWEQMETQGHASYTCPMHPEVESDRPGKCPKCGMDLVPKSAPGGRAGGAESTVPRGASGNAATATAYTCPMHPEVTSDRPGKCPKCGMDLVAAGESEGGGAAMAHDGAGGMMKMSPAQHYKMMVDMAMSTELLPWAMGTGAAGALLVGGLLARANWQLSPTSPSEDAVVRVGELLLSRYMIAFEGAAYLILAGIVGAVVLAKRERRAEQEADASSSHEHGGHR